MTVDLYQHIVVLEQAVTAPNTHTLVIKIHMAKEAIVAFDLDQWSWHLVALEPK